MKHKLIIHKPNEKKKHCPSDFTTDILKLDEGNWLLKIILM